MNDLIKPSSKELIDLRIPHPKFRYPAFSSFELRPDPDEAHKELRYLINPKGAELVHLFSDLTSALEHWISAIKSNAEAGAKLLAFDPFFPELIWAAEKANVELKIVPRDPDEWQDPSIFRNVCGAILSNPNQSDGFFYPEAYFSQLLELICRERPVPILSDESLQSFTFSQVPPPTLRVARLSQKNLFIASSLYPALSPQGPKVSWWIDNALQPLDKNTNHAPIPLAALNTAAQAIVTFNSRQGAMIAEFHRSMLGVKQGLVRMTEMFSNEMFDKQIEVSHWPEAGFYLCLKINKSGYKTAREIQAALLSSENLWLDAGVQKNHEPYLRLCYAAHERILREAALRIKNFLKAPSPPSE